MPNHQGHANILHPELAFLRPCNLESYNNNNNRQFFFYSLLGVFTALIIDPISYSIYMVSSFVESMVGISKLFNTIDYAQSPTRSSDDITFSLSREILSIQPLAHQNHLIVPQSKIAIVEVSNSSVAKNIIPEENFSIETLSSLIISWISLYIIYYHFPRLYDTLRDYFIRSLIPLNNIEESDSDYFIDELSESTDADDESSVLVELTETDDYRVKSGTELILSRYKKYHFSEQERSSEISFQNSHTAIKSNNTSAFMNSLTFESIQQTSEEDYHAASDDDLSDGININTVNFQYSSDLDEAQGEHNEKSEVFLQSQIIQQLVNFPKKKNSLKASSTNHWTLDWSIKTSLNYYNPINNPFCTASNTTSWRFVNIEKDALVSQTENGFVKRCNVPGGSLKKELLSLFDDEDKCD